MDDVKHHLWVYAIGQGYHGEPTCIARNYTVQLVDDFRQIFSEKNWDPMFVDGYIAVHWIFIINHNAQ